MKLTPPPLTKETWTYDGTTVVGKLGKKDTNPLARANGPAIAALPQCLNAMHTQYVRALYDVKHCPDHDTVTCRMEDAEDLKAALIQAGYTIEES